MNACSFNSFERVMLDGEKKKKKRKKNPVEGGFARAVVFMT